MSAPAVAARSLQKRFGLAVALDGIDLEVANGASVAVLGPNGAGKSTLLRLMAGLSRPTRGHIEIGGRPATRREARARIGLIAHETFLYPALTARENLIFASRLHGLADPRARADQLLAEQGLTSAADRTVAGFSRGTAQRLAIARGLVHDPPLVLLDEPYTGLDRRAAERLTGRLELLRAEGRTLVLVTHETAAAARLADVAVVLSRGRVTRTLRAPGAEELERAYLEAADAA